MRSISDTLRLFLACWTALAIIGSPAYAVDDDVLIWSGFAFSGDYANRQHLYPVSAELAAETANGPMLDKVLREKLMARHKLSQRVSLEGSDGRLDQNSLAFSLVQETIETQRIDGRYWVIAVLQANVLVFNMASSSLLASYPVRMRFTRVQDTPPSLDDMKAIVRHMYLSDVPTENIFDQWLDRLAEMKLRAGARKYLRIADVIVTPEAEDVIIKSGKDARAIRNQVANILEASISEKADVPIVPSMLGEVIGAKMALSFMDGSFYSLILPDPDFAVTFTIRGFASNTLEKPSHFEDIYRVKATLAINEPFSGRSYLDEGIYHTIFPVRPKSSNVEFAAWDQYYKTLQDLISMVGAQLAGGSDSWLESNASRAIEAKAGFLGARKLIEELKK